MGGPRVSAKAFLMSLLLARFAAAGIAEDAQAWATTSAGWLSLSGVPTVLIDFASSRQMIEGASSAIWKDLPTIARRVHFAEIFAGSAKTTAKYEEKWPDKVVTISMDKVFGGDHNDATMLTGILYMFYICAAVLTDGGVHFSPEWPG